jgi:hypothetical protein
MALNQKYSEKRKHVRHKLKLRAMLVSGRRLFHTTLENLSLGGAKIKGKPDRDFSYPVVHLLIHDSESSIQLLFKVEFANKDQNQLKFVDLNKAQTQLLQHWIDNETKGISASSTLTRSSKRSASMR